MPEIHLGASTGSSQLLDSGCSHGWKIPATKSYVPTQKGKKRATEVVELMFYNHVIIIFSGTTCFLT